MNCKNDKSCTFLDLFLFILDGIYNGEFNENEQYYGDFYDGQYISPNVILTIREQTQNKFKLTFEQVDEDTKQNHIEVRCTLSFILEYVYDNDYVNLKEFRFTDTHSNSNECDSIDCLIETFQLFLILYNKCKKLGKNVHYNSKHFTIEENNCKKEQKIIRNEIQKNEVGRKTLKNFYLKENMDVPKFHNYVPKLRQTRRGKPKLGNL